MIQAKHLTTPRTARYFTLGSIETRPANVWMTLHGYGMNAAIFADLFRNFAETGDYVVVPEGLSRFYIKGFTGPVGASWMTREDRLNEIKDYTAYLARLYDIAIGACQCETTTIHLLGFSQGAAALCRFLSYAPRPFHHLWICAGEIPEDLDWHTFASLFTTAQLHLMIGNRDEWFDEAKKQAVLNRLSQRHINFTLHPFEGAHEIDFSVLARFRG